MPDSMVFPAGLSTVSHYHQPPMKAEVKSFEIPDRTHKVELMTAGRGWVLQDNRMIEVNPGDLIWEVPGDRTIGRSDPNDPYRCLTVTFNFRSSARGRVVPHLTRWENLDEVRVFTDEVVRCFADETFDRAALLACLWGRLLFQARLYQHQASHSTLPAGLTRVLDHIEKEYHLPLTLEDLAELANWSTAHLHDMFRMHLKSTPHQMLIRRRIRGAREWLIASNDSVKQIARRCGFRSSASFCRRFREVVGISPGRYRQRYATPSAGAVEEILEERNSG